MGAVSASTVLFVAGAALAAVAFIGVVFGANKLLSPRAPSADKCEPYECGMPPAGRPHGRLPLRYAAIAVLFVIFDAEAVLMFAVATRIRGNAAGGAAVLAFAALLALALTYAWRKGALAWRS